METGIYHQTALQARIWWGEHRSGKSRLELRNPLVRRQRHQILVRGGFPLQGKYISNRCGRFEWTFCVLVVDSSETLASDPVQKTLLKFTAACGRSRLFERLALLEGSWACLWSSCAACQCQREGGRFLPQGTISLLPAAHTFILSSGLRRCIQKTPIDTSSRPLVILWRASNRGRCVSHMTLRET